MKLDKADGLITCLDGNEFSLTCGTSASVLCLFDLRFYIRATTMSHPLYTEPKRKRIRTVVLRYDEILCSVDGDNEVSIWNAESSTRVRTLSAPKSHHSVLAIDVRKNNVLTAGSDMTIRHWDLTQPLSSPWTSVCGNPQEAHRDSICSLASNPSTNLLVSASREGVVKLWRW